MTILIKNQTNVDWKKMCRADQHVAQSDPSQKEGAQFKIIKKIIIIEWHQEAIASEAAEDKNQNIEILINKKNDNESGSKKKLTVSTTGYQ